MRSDTRRRSPRPRRRSWLIALPLAIFVLLALAWTGFWFYAAQRADAEIVRWRAREAQQGFFITSAYFSRTADDPWTKVLGRSGLAEMFVPYASGQPRFVDVSAVSLDALQAGPEDLGPCGRLQDPSVIREVRDRGMVWKDHRRGRRGQELALWGTLTAGNYSYLVEYVFRDDGSIAFRAATGEMLGQTAETHP